MLIKYVLIVGIAILTCSGSRTERGSSPEWLDAMEIIVDISSGLSMGLSSSMGYTGDICFTSAYGITKNTYQIANGENYTWPIIDIILDISGMLVDCPLLYTKAYTIIHSWYDAKVGGEQLLWNIGINLPGLYADLASLIHDIPTKNYFWAAWSATDVIKNILNLYNSDIYIPESGYKYPYLWAILLGLDTSIFEGAGSACAGDLYNVYAQTRGIIISIQDGYGYDSWGQNLWSGLRSIGFSIGDCRELAWRSIEAFDQWIGYYHLGIIHYFQNIRWERVPIIRFIQLMINDYKNLEDNWQFNMIYNGMQALGKVIVYDRWPHYGNYDNRIA